MATICYFTLIFAILFLGSGFQSVTSTATDKAAEKAVFCYFGSWATYRWDIALFEVSNIDTRLCSHIIYAYAGLKNGVIASLDEYNDFEEAWGKGNIKKFVTLANNNDVRALIGVGGWNEGSPKYSLAASTAEKREAFADSAVDFIKKHGFHGLQIDWQYPTFRGGLPSDKANYVLLLQTLAEKFRADGLILSIGVGASPETASAAYEFAEIGKVVDHILLLSFDYHTAGDGETAISAPLTADDKLSVDYSINQWLDGGAPANKLVIGVPAYGRTATLADSNEHGLGARVTGPGTAGLFSGEAGLLTYFEHCTNPDFTIVHSDDPLFTYAHSGLEWINYDDAAVVERKAKYVVEKDLGGIVLFSLESEDFGGNCGSAYPLLTAANKGLGRLP